MCPPSQVKSLCELVIVVAGGSIAGLKARCPSPGPFIPSGGEVCENCPNIESVGAGHTHGGSEGMQVQVQMQREGGRKVGKRKWCGVGEVDVRRCDC